MVARCSGWRRQPMPLATSNVTPGSAPTPSPSCSTSGNAPIGHHSTSTGSARGPRVIVDEAGMLSTPDLHRVVTLASGEPVAAGPDRRSPPAARRRPRRPARRAVRQRPRRSARTPAPLQASVGGSRVAARAMPVTRAPSMPTRRTAGSSPAPSTSTSPGWPTPGSPTTSTDARRRWWRRPTTTSTPSTGPSKQARLDAGHLDPDVTTPIAGGEHVHVGDVVATRRNDRRLITTGGEPVRNRDTWTVTAIGDDGSLTVSHHRRTRRRDPSRRLHPRACPARLRGDRARLGVRQRHRRHLSGLVGDDSSRPLRRRHPRRRRERDLRDHRQRRHRRSPRHPRRHRRHRPCRHPRRHPTPQPRPTAP